MAFLMKEYERHLMIENNVGFDRNVKIIEYWVIPIEKIMCVYETILRPTLSDQRTLFHLCIEWMDDAGEHRELVESFENRNDMLIRMDNVIRILDERR